MYLFHRLLQSLQLFFNKNTFFFIPLILICCFFINCKSSRKKPSTYDKRTISSKKGKTGSANYKDVDKVIRTAKSFIGTNYKFGGSTRAGMDCSGLVCTSFKDVGIVLPRTSAAQSQVGKEILLDDLERGDLLFFTDKKGHKKVTHVGIVTDVRGGDFIKFIHSSTRLGVVEDNLFAEYYISIFLKAVRVF